MLNPNRRNRFRNGGLYRRDLNHFFRPLRFESLEDRRLLATVPGLTYIETEVDNANGVDGLQGLFDIVVSPDGKHVYTAGTLEDGLAAFSRDPATGELTFIEALFDNTGGINGLDAVRSVAISPDGNHVYTAGLLDSAVATFSRNATTGKLTFVEVDLDIGALVGLSGASGVTVSPDGKHVYVAARTDNALSAYERDATTGALTFIESEFDGIAGVNGLLNAERLTVSPDGKHVYVAAEGDNAVSVFSRDAMTGAVTFVEAQIDGVGGVDGLNAATSVAVSPDGAHVYVSSGLNLSPLDEDWLATFSRDATTGALTFINHISSTDPLPCTPDAAVFSDTVVTVSPDGKTVYATKGGALVQFSRDPGTGALTVADAVCTSFDPGGLFDELLNPTSVAVSPDGSQVYVGDLVGFLSAFHTKLRDFGDAPTSAQSGLGKDYPTTLAQNGARHFVGNLFLGSLIDAEFDGQPDDQAGQDGTGGDDNNGEADEDGVFVLASMVASSGSSVTVIASAAGKLDAWIDFTRDGDWDDANEKIFNSQDVVAGLNVLSFNVPAGASPGDTGARFRLSSAGGLAPTGAAPDGEVEDYIVTILNGDAAGGADAEIAAPATGTIDVVADGDDVVVRSGAIELFRAPGAKLKSLNIAGSDGDDTLNLANLDAIFAGLIGGNAGGGNDTLRLTGSGQELDFTQIADSPIQGLEMIDITGSGDNTLTLDVNEVLNLSATANTVRVVHDDGDMVNYKTGWKVEIPQIIGGQFVHVLKQTSATIEVINTRPFRNPLRPLDTNRDGTVAPIDALIIVNRLNSSGPGPLSTPTSVAGLTEFFYIDTNGDGSVAPVDVIQVINRLNNPSGQPEGEGTHPVVTLLRNVNSPPFILNPQRHDAQKYGDAHGDVHGDVPQQVAVVRESALRSNATTRGTNVTRNDDEEDLVEAIDAFFTELQAS